MASAAAGLNLGAISALTRGWGFALGMAGKAPIKRRYKYLPETSVYL
jgi:hypothetical protein